MRFLGRTSLHVDRIIRLVEGTGTVGQERPLLVGRRPELTALVDALRRARSGRAQVVVIEGEPGIGKSALLASFVDGERLGDSESLRWLRCDEFEQNHRFGSVGRLLGEVNADASEVEVGRRLLAWFGDQEQEERRGAVLVVDDAQWMDRASANALQFAVRRLGADRVLCLVGRRLVPTGGAHLRTDDPSATTVLRLSPLDPVSVVEMARRRRGWELPPDTAERVVARTGGLPLLVDAVVRGARDEAQLATPTTLPGSVAVVVTRMLDTLDPSTRRLVEAAAILGEPSSLTVVGQVAELLDPAGALTAAVASGLLTEGDLGSVTVSHDLTADAVRQGLDPARRRELHLRAAHGTTGDRRLAHLAAGSNHPDPELAAALVAAADAARADLRYGVAATHRLRARAVAADPAYRERLLVDALVDRVEAEDLDGADELAAPVEHSPPSPRRSLALGLLARERGRVGEARTLLRDSLERAETSADHTTATTAALAGAMMAVWIGDAAAAMELLTHTDEQADSGADVVTDIATTQAIALWLLGDVDQASAVLDAVQRSPAGTASEGELLAVRGMIGFYEGRPATALSDLDAAVQMMHLSRPWTNQSRIFMLRSLTRFVLGDWDGAALDAGAARALAEGPTQLWSQALALSISVDVAAHRGQWAVAEDYLARATESAPALSQIREVVARHAVELARARGDHHGVLAVLDPLWSQDYVARMSRTRQLRPMAVARIAALIAVDRLDEAGLALDAYEESNRRWPGGEEPPQMGLLRGLLAEAKGDPRAARAHYDADLDNLAYEPFPLHQAQLLIVSGRLERTLGRRREAVSRLTRARELLTRLRARPLLERCTRELTACGLPSRLDDPLSLTAREDDVVALVVRGYSNREIAAELFLTVRTVEYHLRNVYAKLGVSGRRELRRRLEDSAP